MIIVVAALSVVACYADVSGHTFGEACCLFALEAAGLSARGLTAKSFKSVV